MRALLPLSALLVFTSRAASTVVRTPATDDAGVFELLILHNNDMHARFEQTSQLSGACTTADREAGKCYGGFPRVAHVVKEARKAAASGEGPPVLYLNAGDTYTGTAWFTIYKWKIAAEFVNALQPDAVSLGNNELQDDSKTPSPFIDNIQTTVLASNIILNSANNTKLQKSAIFEIGGRKVGIVGYLTLDSTNLDSAGAVEYIDEILALKDEVANLQKENVNIIIALGHANIDKDIEIAKEVEGIDMVISGEKNIFYWNGNTKDANENEDVTLIKQLSGKQVPVFKSRAYNKYLGKIFTQFDSDGEIKNYESAQILLDSVPGDVESVEMMKQLGADIATKLEEVVGETAVVLDGESCKTEECNLGNLISDAMMYMYAINYEGERWTDAPIAMIPGGFISASIAPENRPASITRGDLFAALPIGSNTVVVTMNGTILNQVLEYSVSSYSTAVPSYSFLQFSGVRLVYDMEKEIGSRVVNAVVRCWDCYVPQFFTIDDDRIYKVLMPAAMADGEYGYEMLIGLPRDNLIMDEVTSTADYIGLRSPVYPEVAGRIRITNLFVDSSAAALKSAAVLLILAFLHFIM